MGTNRDHSKILSKENKMNDLLSRTPIIILCIILYIVGVIVGMSYYNSNKLKVETITIKATNYEEICIGGNKYYIAYYLILPKLTKDDKQIRCKGVKK